MDNLVRIYDNMLSKDKCNYFVNKFEKHSEMHEIQDCGNGKTLTRINLMSSPDTPFRDDLNMLTSMFMESVEKYSKDCGLKSFQFPDKFGVEPFKIKRYLPNTTDEFPQHVDVNDKSTARRFLVMFVYLTDNDAGETKINLMNTNIVSPCKQGSILMFPPLWPWVHTGVAPVKTPKYIIGSYLHYT